MLYSRRVFIYKCALVRLDARRVFHSIRKKLKWKRTTVMVIEFQRCTVVFQKGQTFPMLC